MKKEEYKKAVELIQPEEGVKDAVLEDILNEYSPKEKRKGLHVGKALGYAAAALAIICVAGVSTPVVASEIRSLLLREVPGYEELEPVIETAVFTKSDEHVVVSVEEILSDGVVVNMTVKYEAVDETGKEWLSNLMVDNNTLSIKPYMENTVEYGVNYSYGAKELEDRRSDTERIFLLELQASSRDYSGRQGVFSFPLTGGKEAAMIDISGNVEVYSYQLVSDEVASEYYTPTFIELSPMSFVIYAIGDGVYEEGYDGENHWERWLLPEEEIDSLVDHSYFIMKDGTYLSMPAGAHNTTNPREENMYSDVMLFSTRFREQDEIYGDPVLINPDEIEAVVINRARFEFVK